MNVINKDCNYKLKWKIILNSYVRNIAFDDLKINRYITRFQ